MHLEAKLDLYADERIILLIMNTAKQLKDSDAKLKVLIMEMADCCNKL